jgi:F-type H+-transporting ATPase subunit a
MAAGNGIHLAIAAEEVTTIGGVPITNTLITSWAVMAILIVGAYAIGRSLSFHPGKFQSMIEGFFEAVLDYMAETLESRQLAVRFFPLIMSLFLFILAANIVKFIPGIGSIVVDTGGGTVPLLRAVNTDLNMTLAVSIIAFLAIEVVGVTMIGFLKYMSKFVNFKSVLGFFIGLIELVSEVARLVAFSFRLFGNIFAGKVLILVVMAFIPVVLPVPLILFELFVGLVQAAIFALLTLFFIKIAMMEPAHE